MIRYAFRLHRWGLIGYGALYLLTMYANGGAFQQLAGSNPQAFAQSLATLAKTAWYLFAAPHRLDTLPGYLQWRVLGPFSLIFLIWAVSAGAGAVRGDEERRLTDAWLATPISRARLVAYRLVAFGLASAIALALGAIGGLLGAARYGGLNVADLVGQHVALWLLTVACFVIVVLVAQVPGSLRGAQVAGAAVLVGLYLVNASARINDSLTGLAWATPFHWYDETYVLAPGGQLSWLGLALSVILIVVATALAALAFARRDVRGALFARQAPEVRGREGEPSFLLSRPVARQLYRQRGIIFGWALGMALTAAYMVAASQSFLNAMSGVPSLNAYLQAGSGTPQQAFLGLLVFGLVLLLVVGMAIHLVAGWAADDTEGILVEVLSTPRSRWTVVAERAVASVVAIAIGVAVAALVTAVAASLAGVGLNGAATFRASWPMLPFGLTFAAAGAVGVARWPRATLGVLGMVAFLSYLLNELGPLLKWPDAVVNLSVFKLYGTPLVSGVDWGGVWGMIAVVVVGFALATLLMQRREVGA